MINYYLITYSLVAQALVPYRGTIDNYVFASQNKQLSSLNDIDDEDDNG